MCAIHGIVDVKPELMMKMVKAAHHRGPDGNGIFEDDYITLGLNYKNYRNDIKQYQNHFVMVTDDNNELYPTAVLSEAVVFACNANLPQAVF